MKKLMIAAVAGVMASGAFAYPQVYDYKATVKHTYLKAKKISSKTWNELIPRGAEVYVKYTKSSSLKGYLVQDFDANACIAGEITKKDAQPGNRCMLVVMNKSAEKNYKMVRILPAVLDAKWYDSALTMGKTLSAQGYLYVGGEVVTAAEGFKGTTFDPSVRGTCKAYDAANQAYWTYYKPRLFTDWQRLPLGDNATDIAETDRAAKVGIDDYFFTSCYLFGRYNQPAWFTDGVAGRVGATAYAEEFADAWMNGAGFGKVVYDKGFSDYCCGMGSGQPGTYVLKNLTGNLKAGLFLCTENGEDDAHSKSLDRTGLFEDQLWLTQTENNPYPNNRRTDDIRDEDGNLVQFFYDRTVNADGTVIRTVEKVDIWADGNLDLRTTDIGYGTWSISLIQDAAYRSWRTGKYWQELTDPEVAQFGAWIGFQPSAGTLAMLDVIKSAAYKLNGNKDVTLFGDPLEVNGGMINKEFLSAYFEAHQ